MHTIGQQYHVNYPHYHEGWRDDEGVECEVFGIHLVPVAVVPQVEVQGGETTVDDTFSYMQCQGEGFTFFLNGADARLVVPEESVCRQLVEDMVPYTGM